MWKTDHKQLTLDTIWITNELTERKLNGWTWWNEKQYNTTCELSGFQTLLATIRSFFHSIRYRVRHFFRRLFLPSFCGTKNSCIFITRITFIWTKKKKCKKVCFCNKSKSFGVNCFVRSVHLVRCELDTRWKWNRQRDLVSLIWHATMVCPYKGHA